MDFKTIIDPMTPEEFRNEYKGKKYCTWYCAKKG